MDTTARLFDSGKSFYMRTCRQGGCASNYFLPTRQGWLDVIRTSSAVSSSYRSGTSLEGINYLDGGISDAIPVREAVRQGAKALVVIRTVPSQMYYTSRRFKRIRCWLGDSSLQPLANLMQHHKTSYREIQQSIEKPPGQSRIFEIYPSKPLYNTALGNRIPTLREDHKLGRLCGRYFLATVGKLLTEKTPLSRHLVPVVTPESIVILPAPVANGALVAEVNDAPQANDPTFSNENLAWSAVLSTPTAILISRRLVAMKRPACNARYKQAQAESLLRRQRRKILPACKRQWKNINRCMPHRTCILICWKSTVMCLLISYSRR